MSRRLLKYHRLYKYARNLTLSHPEALPWRVKSYSVRQSKITKVTVLAGLGEKELRKRDGQVGPVNPFPPRGSPLINK